MRSHLLWPVAADSSSVSDPRAETRGRHEQQVVMLLVSFLTCFHRYRRARRLEEKSMIRSEGEFLTASSLMWSLTLHQPQREKKTLSASWRCSVFLPSSCLIWKTPDDSVVSGGEEALRGERRSGYSSVPRLSTSNPIRSPTRLRVRLQTGSESSRGDEPDDPEWSGSGCRCYGPVVLDAAARLAGGSRSRNTTAKYFIHDSFHLADDMFRKKETWSSCSARKS